jgi:hypothetical protein
MTRPLHARRCLLPAVLALTILCSTPAFASPIVLDSAGLQDVNNLTAIVLALINYLSAFNASPTDYFDSGGTALLSWRVRLLPFLDQQTLFNQFDLTRPWDDPANIGLLGMMPGVYRSPASAAGSTQADYLGGSGPNTMFEGAQGVRLGSITDGTSNTLFVGEAIGSSIPWTMPGDVPIGACPTLGGSGFSSFIPNAVPFAFADGSVRFVPNDISCETLRGLFLRNDRNADTSAVLDYVAAPVPEPSTLSLLTGSAVLILARRLRRRVRPAVVRL